MSEGDGTMKHYRQGDVLVERVRTRPRTGTLITDRGRTILAYGEVTGHAHAIVPTDDTTGDQPAALFEEPDGSRYLFVDRPCALIHEEHGRIDLAPGAYRVTRQREYSPEAIRTVAD
jgi:hypothetical protein